MRNFRDHSRDNDDHQMTAVLSNLSPSTMAEIADWYATQPPAPPAAADLSPKQRAWAEQVVRQGKGVMRGCDYCHGKTELRGVVMPRIDGERAGYLARQLRDFRDGRRADDPRELMRKVAKTLEPDQIDVLAAYLASLPRAAPSQRRSSE
jgi:cytochrome c553